MRKLTTQSIVRDVGMPQQIPSLGLGEGGVKVAAGAYCQSGTTVAARGAVA